MNELERIVEQPVFSPTMREVLLNSDDEAMVAYFLGREENRKVIEAQKYNILEKEKLMANWVEQLAKKDERILELENDLAICRELSKESEDV
jgi:hypothetical protein